MKHPHGLLVYFGIGISAVGCAEATYCQVPTEQVVEMFSWWTQSGETDARKVLGAEHERRRKQEGQPTWVNMTTMANNSLARNFLRVTWDKKQRLPDTFQVNIGQDLLNWKDQLEPVDFLLDEEPGLRDSFFKAVLAEASAGDSLYGIPLNIHRTNTLFYNRSTIASLVQSKEDVDTLEKFESVCEALKLKNPQQSPIALGTKGAAWTLALLAHEALYPAMWGVKQYRSLWRGATTPQTVDHFNQLWQVYEKILIWKDKGWINADFAEIEWTDAANRLFVPDDDKNKAAFFVMGDWVQAEPELMNYADKLGRAPFPHASGQDPVFVYTADSFPLPKNTNNRDNAIALLRTMRDTAVQLAFSQKKGSIPAIWDVGWKEALPYDEVMTEFQTALENQSEVLAVSGCLSNSEMPSNDERVEEMLVKGDIEIIKEFWMANYIGLDPNSRKCFQYE